MPISSLTPAPTRRGFGNGTCLPKAPGLGHQALVAFIYNIFSVSASLLQHSQKSCCAVPCTSRNICFREVDFDPEVASTSQSNLPPSSSSPSPSPCLIPAHSILENTAPSCLLLAHHISQILCFRLIQQTIIFFFFSARMFQPAHFENCYINLKNLSRPRILTIKTTA